MTQYAGKAESSVVFEPGRSYGCGGCTREGIRRPIDNASRGLIYKLLQALCDHCFKRTCGQAQQ